MGKLKPVSPTATPRGQKRRREKPKRPVLDDGLPDSSAGIIAAKAVRREKVSNESPQGLHQSDDDDSDDCNVSSEDEAHDMISNKSDAFDEMESSCSFQRHVTHVLANDEVNALVNQKSKFKWEMPAEDIPKSKWVGTGEKVKGASDDPFVDVKGKLKDHWQKILSDDLNYRLRFFSLCNSYRDIMHCNKKPFYLKGTKVDSSTMDAYLMHALSHVHRTRDVVIKNDAKLRNDANSDVLGDDSYRDQGFTRPKVLFLLPLKSIARRVVKRLIQLSPLAQKDNSMGQFKKEFGESDDELEEPNSSKPTDFNLLFAGDVEDHFLFGIKFTKKSVKLYSNFYASDIIVASPLALKLKIDGGEVTKKKGRPKENDSDFLSSIEIVVVDYADVISMQNWSHLHAVLEQLNHLPSKEHVTNVMRIRPWYLDEQARYYRQTIILSSYLTPEMNALFNGLCLNYEGKVKLVTEFTGVLPKVQLEIRQVYERFDAPSISELDDARFTYFCTKFVVAYRYGGVVERLEAARNMEGRPLGVQSIDPHKGPIRDRRGAAAKGGSIGCKGGLQRGSTQDKKPGVFKSTATHRRNCYCVIIGGLVRDLAYTSLPVALSPGEDTWTMETWINSTATLVWTRPPIGHHG